MSAESRARLSALLADPAFDIAEANLLVAREADPEMEIDPYLGAIDDLASEARFREGGEGVVQTLRRAGFRGDRESYDDPRNSLLHEVLHRRLGLPIALSALTIAVAHRAGVPMAGVGLPGHFVVVDLSVPAEPLYLDAFDSWAALGPEDLDRVVAGSAGVPFDRAQLEPVMPAQVLLRMLANLRGSYLSRGRPADALWAVELMRMIEPGEDALLRDRALLLAALGRDADADEAASGYRADRPDDPERADLLARLAAVRRARRRPT